MFSMTLTMIGALAIFVHTLCSLNDMTHKCDILRRTAYVMMCVGAFGIMADPLFGGIAAGRWPRAAVIFGLGLYFASKQRSAIAGIVMNLIATRKPRTGPEVRT